MSRIISILLVVILLALAWFFFFNQPDLHKPAAQEDKFSSWHDYSAPSGKFHARLPNLPQHAADTRVDEKTKESRDYEMFLTADDDGAAFSINTITFKDKEPAAFTDEFLENTINEMLNNTGQGSVKTIKMLPYKNGQKAAVFSVENEKGLLTGKAFLKGNTLYVLTSIHAQNSKKPETVEYFFESFDFTPEATDKK